MNTIPKSTLIVGAVFVVVLGVAYLYFFTGGEEAPLSATVSASPAEAQFLQLVGQLDPISFDTAILSDQRFVGMADLATPVTPETSGRIDPFAPLPGTKK